MQKKNLASMLVAALAVTALLAGCGKKEEAATPAPAATAPVAAPASTASNDALPAECEAYVQQVQACVDKLGANSPGASAVKQGMDQARAGWAQVTDKAALGASCKQVSDAFANSAKGIGC